MPRYHLKIKGSDLRGVRREVPIAVKGHGRGKNAELTVELRAKNEQAAKALVVDRLPSGSDAVVSDPVKVGD